MKQSFLNSLVGMTVKAAKAAVKTEGYKVRVMKEGTISILLAYPGTIKLYHNDSKIVTSAHAGDPLEVS